MGFTLPSFKLLFVPTRCRHKMCFKSTRAGQQVSRTVWGSRGEPMFGDGRCGCDGPLHAGLPTGTGRRELHGLCPDTGTPRLMLGRGLAWGHAAALRLALWNQSLGDFSEGQNSPWQAEAFLSALLSPRCVTSRAPGEELLSHPGTSAVPFSTRVWGSHSPIPQVPAVPVRAA